MTTELIPAAVFCFVVLGIYVWIVVSGLSLFRKITKNYLEETERVAKLIEAAENNLQKWEDSV